MSINSSPVNSFVHPSYDSNSFSNQIPNNQISTTGEATNKSINNNSIHKLSQTNDATNAHSSSLKNNSSTYQQRTPNDERRTSVRTQQSNEKANQPNRNNSIRSTGRIAGRNQLYSSSLYTQGGLPTKYEFETPGQVVQLNVPQQETNQSSNHCSTNNQANNQLIQSNNSAGNNQLNGQLTNSTYNSSFESATYDHSNSSRTSRPKLVYQPASHDSDNTTVQFNDNRSTREDNVSVGERFRSNYEKFLEISKNIDFEEKLINLQLNKSKLKASARTSGKKLKLINTKQTCLN